jgi:hypothetical protein
MLGKMKAADEVALCRSSVPAVVNVFAPLLYTSVLGKSAAASVTAPKLVPLPVPNTLCAVCPDANVTANVPVFVIGDPATVNTLGMVRATLETPPDPDPAAVVSSVVMSRFVELTTTRASKQVVGTEHTVTVHCVPCGNCTLKFPAESNPCAVLAVCTPVGAALTKFAVPPAYPAPIVAVTVACCA